MVILLIFSGGGPPTPLSPFEPHSVEFPPTAATFSVSMERGFIVLTKIPDVERNSLVNNNKVLYCQLHCRAVVLHCYLLFGLV